MAGAQVVCACTCDDYWTYGVDGPSWPGGDSIFVAVDGAAACDVVREGYNRPQSLTVEGQTLYCPQAQTRELACDTPNTTCERRTCEQMTLPGGGTPRCGEYADGCGGTIGCGTCPPGRVCASGVCASCAPRTCESAEVSCGTIDDGCGGSLPCGACEGGYVVFSLGEESPKIGIELQQTSMLAVDLPQRQRAHRGGHEGHLFRQRSAALGAGVDWERRTGACPNRDCRYFHGQGEVGLALDVKGSAKSWIVGETSFGGVLGLTCSANVGFDTCRQGGLRVDPDCKLNETSFGELP